MANPFKGEVAIEVDGKSYKLSFSFGALIELEEALGKPLDEIIGTMRGEEGKPPSISLKDMRVLFWAALNDHQPGKTLDDIKPILSRVSLHDVTNAVGQALMLSLPAGEEGGGELADVRPQMPDQAGTGPGSSKAG